MVMMWRVAVLVDVVDHRRQRRRLAAAGGAGDQDQAALLLGDAAQDRRQVELLEAAHALRDDAQDDADGAALLEDVAAEAAQAGHAVGQVELLGVLEPLALVGGHDRRRHVDQGFVVEPDVLGQRPQLAVDADDRVVADLEVDVRGAVLDRRLEQLVDVHRPCRPGHIPGRSVELSAAGPAACRPGGYWASPQNGQVPVRACRGLPQCQQNRPGRGLPGPQALADVLGRLAGRRCRPTGRPARAGGHRRGAGRPGWRRAGRGPAGSGR